MATSVHPGLWIGDYKDAKVDGKYDIILDIRAWFLQDRIETKILDIIAGVIEEQLGRNKVVLVHSEHGFERAPLVVAWWMVKYKHSTDMDAAYDMIRMDRPQVVDRRKGIVMLP
jgi:protein-tyrosine phosphatase